MCYNNKYDEDLVLEFGYDFLSNSDWPELDAVVFFHLWIVQSQLVLKSSFWCVSKI